MYCMYCTKLRYERNRNIPNKRTWNVFWERSERPRSSVPGKSDCVQNTLTGTAPLSVSFFEQTVLSKSVCLLSVALCVVPLCDGGGRACCLKRWSMVCVCTFFVLLFKDTGRGPDHLTVLQSYCNFVVAPQCL